MEAFATSAVTLTNHCCDLYRACCTL